MTASELRRRLAKAGCTFEDRKKHTRVFYQDRESHMPRHPSKEVKKEPCKGYSVNWASRTCEEKHVNYQALFEPAEEGGFIVTFPDFEFGITQGDTEAEARAMAEDSLALVIESYIEQGKPLPTPTHRRGRQYRVIKLPALQAAKTELYRQFMTSGLRKVDLAQRLGIPKTVIDRLFDLNHHSRLDQIEAAFAVLGKRLAVQIEDAA